MNIAQELSIVRDNIAEYGMTNITQLEYDAIYEQGRADAIKEYNKKIDYLKNCYVDACNMCTRMECGVCTISNFIEDLEQLKEQK